MTDTQSAADRVVLRYSTDADGPGTDASETDGTAEKLDEPSYRAYLRRTLGAVAVGDEFDEFVSRGCGGTRDVTLTVAAVEGGDRVGEATELAFVPA